MTETYTLSMLGCRESTADGRRVVMPDSLAQGLGSTVYGRNGTVGLSVSAVGQPYGNLNYMAQRNQHQLCRNADGSFSYYVIDASRSDPARGLIYLLPSA